MSVLPPVLDRRRRPAFVRLVLNGLFQAGAIIGAMILVRHAFNVMLNPAFDDPEVHLFDMREVWQLGDNRAHGSLGAISRHLGLGDKAGNGADFSLLWNTDRQAAIDYCLRDVQLTQQVADILIPAY